MKKATMLLIVVTLLVGVGIQPLIADEYPTRPIRMIVPFPPGGGNDLLARSISQPLSQAIGQSVVVDNRGGAGGQIGATLAAAGAPDGYTIFLGSIGNLTFLPVLQPKLQYEPIRDFAPVTLLATSAFILVVNPAVPAKSVKELIALAKSQPGKLNYGGICGAVCPAIDVKHKPFTAESGKVEGEVVWDETKCDACKVCVELCPEECITVEREIVSDKMAGEVNIDQKQCCTCTWCSVNCPTEAITIEKIFTGDIEFNATKCPGGCSTCVDICPANAIYLPTPKAAADMKGEIESTIAVNKDFCILCGACVNACPGEDIIVLKRDGVRIKGEETDLFKKIKAKLFEKRTSKVKEDIPAQVNLKMMEKA